MPKKGSEAVKVVVILVLSLLVIFALVSLFKGKGAVAGKAVYIGSGSSVASTSSDVEYTDTEVYTPTEGWRSDSIRVRCNFPNSCASYTAPRTYGGRNCDDDHDPYCIKGFCYGVGSVTESLVVDFGEWCNPLTPEQVEDGWSACSGADACGVGPETDGCYDSLDDDGNPWCSSESYSDCMNGVNNQDDSIVLEDFPYACMESFTSPDGTTNQYAWVACETATDELVTDDQRHICQATASGDGGTWKRCGSTAEGAAADREVYHNFYCDASAEQWTECGGSTACVEAQVIECNSETRFQTKQNYNGKSVFCNAANYWVVCSPFTLGWGVDNIANAFYSPSLYDNRVVCNGNQWIPTPQCAPCRGTTLEGRCIGSSRAEISDRIGRTTPYSSNPTQMIGCVPESNDETGYCYYNQRDFPYGTRSPVDNNLVCGNQRTTLTCSGATPLASDDESWLCQAGAWRECTASITGQQQGNFVCSFNPAQNEWIWFSEFSCGASQLYQTRTNGQFICDGSAWRSCAEFDAAERMTGREPGPAEWFTSLISDPANVEVSCEVNNFSVRELNCDDNRDNDRDGLYDTEDTDCSDPVKVFLHPNNWYQYNLRKGQLFSISVHPGEEQPAVYERLNVCDTGTSAIQNRLTLCQSDAVSRTLESTALLRQTFSDPPIDGNNFAFLFEQEITPKTASIMLHFNLASPRTFPLTTFAPNLIAGQRIMFSLDGEHYLLSHEARPAEGTESAAGTESTGTGIAAEGFAESALQLTHIETGEEFPASLYPGTNVYVFHVLGSRVISAVLDTGSNVARFTALAPGEAPESFPVLIPQSWFEASFSSGSPIRITTSNLGILSICRQDNPADRFTALICRNNNLAFTLQENTYSRRTVQNREYLFRYSFDAAGGKKVSVFQLYSCASAEFAYNAFINQLLRGEDIACQLNNRLYFIKHPLLPQFSVLSLGAGDETGFTALPSEGSTPTSATFSVTGASITVDRSVDTPQAPFRVTARAVEELTAGEDVLLPEEFYATLTTANSVRIGTVSLRQCNQELFQFTTAANVCLSTGEDIAVTRGELFTIGGQRLLLEVNGATGNAKEVFIRKLLTFTSSQLTIDDWSAFTQRIRNNDVPAIELPDGRLFRPEAGSQQLQDFSLEPFPSGISLTLRNREELTPITSRGAFVAGNTIIAAQQEAYGPATARKIRTIFTVQPQPYLPEDRSAIMADEAATQFSVQPGGVVYTISAEGRTGGLVQLRLDGESLLFRTSLAAGDSRRLFLENVRVEIKVVSLGETAVLEIRRL